MSVGIGKAELKVKYIVVVMYNGDEVNSESGDNEFNSVNANAKGGEVIKNGYKHLNPLHILFDFNNMYPSLTVFISKMIDSTLLAMTIAFNLYKI